MNRIGPYELLGELGRGGMGVVYRARGPAGGEVAVKLLLAADPDAVARFDRERRLLALLGEEAGFVPILDAGTHGGRVYLVMPFLPGGTLRTRLATGPLGVAEAVELGLALARALAAAHERGIVHRDLKPENVLVATDGRPLVADLGLAKHFRRDVAGASVSHSLSVGGTFAGTVGYAPAEQLDDARAAGPPADVFALGVILYEALTGRRPFEGDGLLGYVKALRSPPASVRAQRPDVPAWLADTILRCLAPDPPARFPDAGALARALAPAPRRTRPGLALAVALLLVLAGAAALLARRSREERRREALVRATEALERSEGDDPASALALAERALATDPDCALAHVALGVARLARGDRDGALAACDRAVTLDPSSARAWRARAAVRLAIHDARVGPMSASAAPSPPEALAPAVADATRAIELDPGVASAWLARAEARFRSGQLDEALEDAERASRAAPRAWPPLVLRAWVLVRRGQVRLALDELDRAVAVAPRVVPLRLDRSGCRRKLGDLPGALADLDEAVRLAPRDVDVLVARANLRATAKDDPGALEDLEAALALAPEHAPSLLARARLLRKTDRERALADLERLLARDPGDREVRMMRATLLGARALELPRNHPEFQSRHELARDELVATLRLDADDPGCLLYLGRVHINLGEQGEAAKVLGRLIDLDLGRAEPWFWRGFAEFESSQYTDAVRDVTRALEIGEPSADAWWLRDAWYLRGEARIRMGDRSGADDLAHYLELVPRGRYADVARQRLAQLGRSGH